MLHLVPGWPRLALLLLPVLLGAAVLTAVLTLAPPAPTSTVAAAPAALPALPPPAGLLVHVSGAVMKPGLYRLQRGDRVYAAIAAAGGVGRGVDLTGINLARKLTDGEQIAIGVPGAGPPGGSAGGVGAASGAASGAVGGLVELNSATLAQLDGLPGVGPVLAQHIVDWRSAHGRFDSVEQLKNVSGIGDAKFADLKPLVTVA